MLAQVAWEKGDLDAAAAHVRRIKDLDPELPLGDGWWIRWQLEFGDPAEAAKTLSEHPEVSGDTDAWSQVEFGTLHLLNMKRWKDLTKLYDASVTYDTHNIQWDLTGAIAYWAQGDKAKSDAIIADCRKRYPDKLELISSIEASRDQIVTNGG